MSRRVIRLESEIEEGRVRFLSDRIDLADGRTRTVTTVTRTGRFVDPRYGEFEITREMLLSMVKNFEANVYGQEIFVDVAHRPSDGAAGRMQRLFLDGNKLRAEIEWTPFGVDAIKHRGFRYLSAEYDENFVDNEKRQPHGPTLLAAGLTIRPVVKSLDPVQLSEDSLAPGPTLVSQRIIHLLQEDFSHMKEFLEKLRKRLAELKLVEPVIKQLAEAFEAAAKPLAEDKAKLELLFGHFEGAGKQLAEAIAAMPTGAHTIKLDFAGLETALKGAGGKTLSEDDIKRVLAEQEAERENKTKQLAETKAAKVKLFTDALDKAEGLKSLSEDARKELAAAGEIISAEMSEEQVKKLADRVIAMGNQIAVSAKLAAMGFRPEGQVHITLDSSNEIKALQEEVDKRLYARMPAHKRYALSNGAPIEANKAIVEEALALFDQQNARQLHEEYQRSKQLAAGDSVVSDVAIPSIFERTVIREALYQLVGLGLCDVGTHQFSSVVQLPYSYRDTTAAGKSASRKYEGQSIARAAVKQALEEARPIPQKLAFEVSDELRYLVGNGQINFDIVAENARNAARIIGEDTESLIFDEILNASDQYTTVAVTNEATATANGTNRIFVLDNFPVVRPKKVYDLQGNQVGSTLYPITITLNAVAINEWAAGVAAGTYYVMNHNLGEITFVNETGASIAPPNTQAIVASYTYTTNVHKWDSDLGALKVDEKYDDFLYRFGLRKVAVEDRAYMPNIGIMSGTLRTQIEQARQFGANFKRAGTDLMADGNLGRIKDVPGFRSYAPGLAIGDVRTVIGERGTVRFRMVKPWTLGELENQKDSNGRFTGKKEAYGDQFVIVHTPTLLKGAQTSMVIYSATGRVDRVS